MQKKKGTNNNRNTSYYKSRVEKPKNNGSYSFLESKKRQMSSYIRAITVLLVLMIIVTAFIFLGIFLKNLVENTDNDITGSIDTTTANEVGITPPTQEVPTVESALSAEEEEAPLYDIPEIYSRYNGVYLDVRKLDSMESLQDFITRIKLKDVNAVNIDIKTEDGIIPYNIGGQFAAVVGEENQIDLKLEDIINLFHENGLYVSGTIVCFKDDLAATTHAMSSFYVVSTNMRWTDASGSSWLNIYTEGAKNYITSLVTECLNLGLDEIILSHFYLPNVSDAGALIYNDEGVGKIDAVTGFVSDIRGIIDEISPKVKLGLYIPVREFWNMPNETMGVSPDKLLGKFNFFTTSFAPADAPAITLDISDPESNPYETVKALSAHFQYLIDDVGFRPTIQGFNSYTDDSINSQKQALRDAGISVWSVVNFDNNY